MKKVLSFVLSLCFAVVFCALVIHFIVFADYTSGSYSYTVLNGEATITKYNGYASSLTISGMLGGYPVTRIGDNAFEFNNTLSSITLPNSVTSIGKWAFSACSKLVTITLGSGVKYIGDGAFDSSSLSTISVVSQNQNYSSVSGVLLNKEQTELICFPEGKKGSYSIPVGVTHIGKEAFSGCTQLTSITFPNSVVYIGDSAFFYCKGLKSVSFPNSVKAIDNGAFYACTNLTSIILPNDLLVLGMDSFTNTGWYNNQSNGMVYLENWAYMYKGNMPPNTQITIESGTVGIAGGAFIGCENLKQITIPSSVKSVCYAAFESCPNITTIAIPGSVQYIGPEVFAYCENLTTITIPFPGNTLEDDFELFGRSNLCDNIFGLSYTGEIDTWYPPKLKNVTILSAKTIPVMCFEGCHSLTTVHLPNTLLEISMEAFCDCTNLTTFNIPDSVKSIDYAFYGTAWYNSQPNGLVYKDNWCFGYKGMMPSNTKIAIQDGTRGIIAGAFWNSEDNQNQNLKDVILPDGLVAICRWAFSECTGLSSISIPGSVESVGRWAFESCTKLKTLEIKNGVKRIELGAFCDCTSLTSVVIPKSVTSIEYDAFGDCIRLNDVLIYGSPTFGTPEWESATPKWEDVFEYHDSEYNIYNIPLTLHGFVGSSVEEYAQRKGFSFEPIEAEILYGNVDGDGNIDLGDITLLAKHIAGWVLDNEFHLEYADCDDNGVIDIGDITLLAKYVAGWDVVLGPQV